MSGYLVKLPAFEGPFDLLYHLIEEQKINIYDIPVATIANQYLEYLHLMEILDMEVASEFLIMAATLLEIKSRMLLPKEKPADDENSEFGYENGEEAFDARTELVEKLLEYRKFKLMALELCSLEAKTSRIYTRNDNVELKPEEILQISITGNDLVNLYTAMVRRVLRPPVHRVVMDKVSIVEKINEIRAILRSMQCPITFDELIRKNSDNYNKVLSFMALLEMNDSGEITLNQPENFATIQIKSSSDRNFRTREAQDG